MANFIRDRRFLLSLLLLASLTATARLFLAPPPGHLDPRLGQTGESYQEIFLRQQVDHPVTKEMTQAASQLTARPAPDFQLMDASGQPNTLAKLTNKKPAVFFFIEKNCPCCVGAKYFVDRLALMYGDRVNVVGVINDDAKGAKAWIKATGAKWPILLDPKMRMIKDYSAERGVYTTLVSADKRIVKAYPGYSKQMLQDLSDQICAQLGQKLELLVIRFAPDNLTSGCRFPSSTSP